jgi:predicted Rossmann fold nucleotide-binding protein DprA/Smf involved in DNA uptake
MQKNTDAVLFWIGLSSIPGVGRITFRKLIKQFGSPERALTASSRELADVEGSLARPSMRSVPFPGAKTRSGKSRQRRNRRRHHNHG